jgi:hypothetical protein
MLADLAEHQQLVRDCARVGSGADHDGRSPARAHGYVEPRADASGVPTDRGGAADGRGDKGQSVDVAVMNYEFLNHYHRGY